MKLFCHHSFGGQMLLAALLFLGGSSRVQGWSVSKSQPAPAPSQEEDSFQTQTVNNIRPLAASRRQVFASVGLLTVAALDSSALLLTSNNDNNNNNIVVRPAYAKPAKKVGPPVMGLSESYILIERAREQLEEVPGLIKKEQWDSVRAVLIKPPLADCWAKTARPLLDSFAVALGAAGGDEFAALEAKEEALLHLRYLDMAVYNNVFNPIKTEGETGATPALIKSYYEDPMNEWKASVQALDDLLRLEEDTLAPQL